MNRTFNILNGKGSTFNLPRDYGMPAAPSENQSAPPAGQHSLNEYSSNGGSYFPPLDLRSQSPPKQGVSLMVRIVECLSTGSIHNSSLE